MIMLNNRPVYVGNVRPLVVVETPEPTPPSDEVQIGNQIWKTTYLDIDDGNGDIAYNESNGLYYYTPSSANRVANTIDGWRLPTTDDINTLLNYIGSQNKADIISVDDGGTDIYGLGLRLAGMKYGSYSYVGNYGYLITTTYGWLFGINTGQYYNSSVRQGNVRLIKDVT